VSYVEDQSISVGSSGVWKRVL